jgi:hypothetical protein
MWEKTKNESGRLANRLTDALLRVIARRNDEAIQ